MQFCKNGEWRFPFFIQCLYSMLYGIQSAFYDLYFRGKNMLFWATFLVRLVYLLSDRNECCVYDRYYSIAKYNFVAGTQY